MKKFLIVFCATLLLLPATVRADEMDLEMPSLEEMRENISEMSYDSPEQEKLCHAISGYGPEYHGASRSSDSILERRVDDVKAAIEKGADVNSPCGNWPSLYDLVDQVHLDVYYEGKYENLKYFLEMMQLLVDNGADVNEVSDGETLLGWAITSDRRHGFELTKFLLENGITTENINNQVAFKDFNALCFAAFTCHPEIVSLLIDYGANVNVHSENDKFKGWTPLMITITTDGWCDDPEQKPEVVRVLLDAGADAKITNNDGDNALDVLMKHRPEEMDDETYNEIFEMLHNAI